MSEDYSKAMDLKSFLQRIKQTDPDLYAIAQNETSGGINLDHPVVTGGLNKGHKAGGAFGMMPITAKEIIGRNKAIQQQYADVNWDDPNFVTQKLNADPQLSYALAKAEYERRLQQLGGDKSKAAYSWFNGLTGAKRAKPEDIMASDYVQKYLKHLSSNSDKVAEQPINKFQKR